MAAISEPNASICLDGHAATRAQLLLNTRNTRMCRKGALNCGLDGKTLCGGKPLGKSLGFLREIDHAR